MFLGFWSFTVTTAIGKMIADFLQSCHLGFLFGSPFMAFRPGICLLLPGFRAFEQNLLSLPVRSVSATPTHRETDHTTLASP